MKRKVIKQANQAFTITLPIDWARKNRLSERSEVDIEVDGKSLIINSDKPVAGGKVSVDVNGMYIKNIYRYLNSFYAVGIDEIEVLSKKDISADLINYFNQTIGYALVEQKGEKYLIKDIGGGEYKDLDEIFKRVFQIILLFYESAINDIFGENKETIKSLDARDLEVNKFCLYLQRAINKFSYPDPIKGRVLFTCSYALEKISDEIHRLWRTAVKYRIKKSPALKRLVELSCEGLCKSFDFHFRLNQKIIEEIFDLREKVRNESLNLMKVGSHTLRFVRHVVKIIEDAADLSHLSLMMNYKQNRT